MAQEAGKPPVGQPPGQGSEAEHPGGSLASDEGGLEAEVPMVVTAEGGSEAAEGQIEPETTESLEPGPGSLKRLRAGAKREPPPALTAFAVEGGARPSPSAVGLAGSFVVTAAFDLGYLVDCQLANQEFKGVLYCPPEGFLASQPAPRPTKAAPRLPKRNKTAFNFYAAAARARAKAENPHADQKDISRVVGDWWTALPAVDKKPYMEMAREDRERYERELVEYQGVMAILGASAQQQQQAAAAAVAAATATAGSPQCREAAGPVVRQRGQQQQQAAAAAEGAQAAEATAAHYGQLLTAASGAMSATTARASESSPRLQALRWPSLRLGSMQEPAAPPVHPGGLPSAPAMQTQQQAQQQEQELQWQQQASLAAMLATVLGRGGGPGVGGPPHTQQVAQGPLPPFPQQQPQIPPFWPGMGQQQQPPPPQPSAIFHSYQQEPTGHMGRPMEPAGEAAAQEHLDSALVGLLQSLRQGGGPAQGGREAGMEPHGGGPADPHGGGEQGLAAQWGGATGSAVQLLQLLGQLRPGSGGGASPPPYG